MMSNAESSSTRTPVCPRWTKFTVIIHEWILLFVVSLSVGAARHPRKVVIGIAFFSVAVLFIGMATNFKVVYDPEKFLIPLHTRIEKEYNWISKTFPDSDSVSVSALIHENGDNVLTVDTTRRAMQLMDAIGNTSGYDDVCSQGNFVDIYGERTCWTYSVARFWNYNISQFDSTVHSDREVVDQISKNFFDYGGTPVSHDAILGNFERNETTDKIDFAQSYFYNLVIPNQPGVKALELAIIDNVLELRNEWRKEFPPVYLEFASQISLQMEAERAIRNDLPLLPVVFIIMTNFCSVVFLRRHKVKSRWLLGYGAVVTVAMSLMTGFGILFCAGIPVTSMLLVLPFIVFGIALDDTFIITGSWFRISDEDSNDAKQDIVERVRNSMQDIGLSITMTTLTTMVAFLLTSISTIRAIRWLGWYAFLTIFIDFIYQITFFVALMVIDEHRIQANRRDICFCVVVKMDDQRSESGILDEPAATGIPHTDGSNQPDQPKSELSAANEGLDDQIRILQDESQKIWLSQESHNGTAATNDGSDLDVMDDGESENIGDSHSRNNDTYHFADRLLLWYSQKIIPSRWFQVIMLAIFLGYFAVCSYSTTLLKQEDKSEDFVPDDSYVKDYIEALDSYMTLDTAIGVYFRGINQSDPQVQEEMRSAVDNFIALDHVGGVKPPLCWVRDLPLLEERFLPPDLKNRSFIQKIDYALSDSAVEEAYGSDIVRDNKTGEILASRCWIYLGNLDFNNVQDQLEFYRNQGDLTTSQAINKNRYQYGFFSFDYIYFIWEFYSAIVSELKFSTISGVVAVGLIGFLLIPHWSATFFLLPIIVILYVDVMGTIEMMGLHIDSMSFICIIMSVGLLVDFLMHVLLRYFESPGATRLQKVQATLQTIGPSIFVGGLSTFFGILPLSLATSMVMRTVFLCFLAMISIGVAHGLVFLPVVLSLGGPVGRGQLTHGSQLLAQKKTSP